MKSSKTSSSDPGAPRIPDYELLRRIGKGGYGEVYIGRSVTGKLRAIKTVRRNNFEDERTFEREFEGIQHYEELSREHEGLVDILHVGRNDEQGFYYYIMQLADDVEQGRNFEVETYVPLTLSGKLRAGKPLPVEECLCVGRNIAGGLEYLHREGLAHRDIKPSNIIYLRGVPQLADPGLVAASGEQTFVGTEGYVPPEGPGSTLADLYGLGIVLYEMNTGKDRFDFPELPTRLDAKDPSLKQRAVLNQVLCRAAHPKAHQRYPTGTALIAALDGVITGRVRKPRSSVWSYLLSVAILGVASAAAFGLIQLARGPAGFGAGNRPAPIRDQRIEITSNPSGARVFMDGEFAGKTPLNGSAATGTVDLRFELEGHRTVSLTYPVRRSQENRAHAELGDYLLPKPGESWTNHLGHRFDPVPEQPLHRSASPIHDADFTPFLQAVDERTLHFERGAQGIIYASPATQRHYSKWMTRQDHASEYLPPDHVYMQEEVEPLDGFADLSSFVAVVGPPLFGTIRIVTHPAGAELTDEAGTVIGKTPAVLREFEIGPVRFGFRLAGHKPQEIDAVLAYRQDLDLEIFLEGEDQVDLALPWTNSLGMSLVPAGEGLLCAIHETTVAAFEAFWDAQTQAQRFFDQGFEQSANHPVTHVSLEDARQFCNWLNTRERALGRIPENSRYRLPSDAEWSRFAGLPDETGATPRERDREYIAVYPWGRIWPPPPNAGNFAGVDAADLEETGGVHISGYDDRFPRTAPVGSFPANLLGLHDLEGNVSEWVEDRFEEAEDTPFPAVLRGGNWLDSSPDHLRSSYRGMSTADLRAGHCGFRVVLAEELSDDPEETRETKMDIPDNGVLDALERELARRGKR